MNREDLNGSDQRDQEGLEGKKKEEREKGTRKRRKYGLDDKKRQEIQNAL